MKIQDPSLGKYEILIDQNNYTVVENTGKKDKEGNDIFKNMAYCSSTESAIKRIVKYRVQDELDVCDLNDYLIKLKDVSNEVKNALTIDIP